MDTFGSRLKKARLEKGLTQNDLAKRASLSDSAISGLESGYRKVNDTPFVLGKALNKRPEYLLYGALPEEPIVSSEDLQNYYIAAKTPEELAQKLLDKGDKAVLDLLALVMELKNKKAAR